ncbi:hypothetical protein V1523DRAFT_418598 [Lipomyces doorenjongii]
MSQPHALVLGASGISGWSLLSQLRTYPSAGYWKRITGTTNRPFSFEQARIAPEDRIQLVSGINLTDTVDKIVDGFRSKVKDIDTVTHVFFTAYIAKDGFQELKQINNLLLENTIKAVEKFAPKLESIILQTGGKGYGLEFPKEVKIRPPLKEDMPRIPKPWYDNIFYYTQYDLLQELSKGKKWTFSEIRPDGIVGFVPGTNAMNMAQGIAIYLALYRKEHGENAEVPFPGYEHGYHSTHSDTFQDLLAKFEIFAAVNPDKCGSGGVFNIADQDQPVTWSYVWPGICEYFGLKGVGPREGTQPMQEFVQEHISEWQKLCESLGLEADPVKYQNWGHVHFMLVQFDFDRQYDLSHARQVGFTESIDTVQGYRIALDRMAAAKVIPKF